MVPKFNLVPGASLRLFFLREWEAWRSRTLDSGLPSSFSPQSPNTYLPHHVVLRRSEPAAPLARLHGLLYRSVSHS